jgi:hypothetical protein
VRTLSDSTVLAFGAYAADAEFDECIPADATPQLIAERLQVATKQQQERLDAVRKFTRRRRKDDDT